MTLKETIIKYLLSEKVNNEAFDNTLLKTSIEQSLQTILYPVYGNKEYKKYYISWAMKQESFYALQKEITSLFNENEISHVYFKGSVTSKLYDDPSVRTRGDIDLYVNPNEFEVAKKLLLSNGYEEDLEIVDCMHHLGLRKNGIEVELHFSMLDTDCDKAWIAYLKDPFSLCIRKESYLYEYTPTAHFIYSMMHFAHHLRTGAGIRYMLDYYYMLKKTDIDYDLLHKKLKEVKLERLYSNIINALRELSNVDFDNSIAKENVAFFIDYMLSFGIHGFSNNETSIHTAVHKHKVRYLFGRVFMTNKAYRQSLYPKMGRHWYFYIFCLIHHLCFLIFHKMGAFFTFLFGKNKNKHLYKNLGI